MNETNFKLTPDDPKLTAYALGELEGEERAAVEAAIRVNPALGAVVEEIRALTAQLETALAAEAAPGVAPVTVADVKATAAKAPSPAGNDPYARRKGAKVLQFPQVYFLVGGLAAACFAVLLAVKTPRPAPKAEVKHYVEMPLAALEEPVATENAEPVALAKMARVAAAGSPEAAGQVALPRFDAKAADLLAEAKGAAAAREAKAAEDVIAANQARAAGETAARHAEPKLAAVTQAQSGAGAAAGGRTWSYPADEGMVITAQPAPRADTTAGPAEMPAVTFALTVETPHQAPVPTGSSFAGTAAKTIRGEARGYAAATTLAGTRLSKGVVGGAGGSVAPSSAETYAFRRESDFLAAKENPLSTFAADVDTASYANVRRFLAQGQRPPADAVRIEELLNYFPFAYAAPQSADVPFAATMEVAPAPWAANHQLVRIGLKGREVSTSERGAANLVFLLDVSGSMAEPNKLPLVQESMRLLLARLRPDDRVAIVTYAGASGLALPSTPVKQAREIAAAIDELRAGGSTNGALGLHLAYDIAKANFIAGGINRVILCTDGDFNVGVTGEGALVRLIAEKAKSKVFLTALGFGMGNYKDATLQQIADAGNGNYGYIDTRREAEKLLVAQVSGTLVTIAKDVKLQVEFNPAKVASYRLIGYEKRLLKKEDFNNDQVDAGEIGAGHAVTALYEIVPVGAKEAAEGPAAGGSVDELRYVGFGAAPLAMRPARPEVADELLTLKVRYKEPAGETSKRLEFPLADRSATFAAASRDFKFAAAVAGFGMILRDSPHKGAATLEDVAKWAEAGIGNDPGGYRTEFVDLVKQARALE